MLPGLVPLLSLSEGLLHTQHRIVSIMEGSVRLIVNSSRGQGGEVAIDCRR